MLEAYANNNIINYITGLINEYSVRPALFESLIIFYCIKKA